VNRKKKGSWLGGNRDSGNLCCDYVHVKKGTVWRCNDNENRSTGIGALIEKKKYPLASKRGGAQKKPKAKANLTTGGLREVDASGGNYHEEGEGTRNEREGGHNRIKKRRTYVERKTRRGWLRRD